MATNTIATSPVSSGMSIGAKIGIGLGIAAIIGVIIYAATSGKSSSAAKGSTGGATGNKGGTPPTKDGSQGTQGSQTGGGNQTSTTTSITTNSIPTQQLPPVDPSVQSLDMTGNWQATDGSYNPVCSSTMLSFGGNDTLNVPYETTAVNTITFMNDPTIIAAQPSGAVTGTLNNLGSEGEVIVGTTVTWNDVHHGTWIKIS